MNITFLLPGDNRSGGVRVTVLLGNLLIDNSHEVRILYKKKKLNVIFLLNTIFNFLTGRNTKNGWFYLFKGHFETYSDINRASFKKNEIVVGVGTYMIKDLLAIDSPVKKLRYNHGFPADFTEEYKKDWAKLCPTITVSNTLVKIFEDNSNQKILGVVPNGIDLSQYYVMQDQTKIGIGFIFSSHTNKAPDFLLELIDEIHTTFPDLRIVIVSAEKIPNELSKYETYHLPSIEKFRHVYNSVRIWTLPSDTEGLPGPVLESMACGTPVLSSDNDGSCEIINHNENGVIVPRRDKEAFIKAINELLTNDILWKSIRSNGLSTAKQFSWEKTLVKFEDIISKL